MSSPGAPLHASPVRSLVPITFSMNLESRSARRAVAAFGIAWNGAIFLLLALSSGPFLVKAGYLLYGGWALVNMAALWGWEARSSRLLGMAIRRLLCLHWLDRSRGVRLSFLTLSRHPAPSPSS